MRCFQNTAARARDALLAAASMMLWITPALSQTPPVQTCQLGNLTLESGEVIRDFRMTYIVLGFPSSI